MNHKLAIKNNERSCFVCGSMAKENLFHNEMASMGVFNLSYDVVACKNCLFVYADGIPSEEVYKNYYTQCSKYDVIKKRSDISPMMLQRANYAAEFITPHISFDTAILDLGSSIGVLLNEFKRRGFLKLRGIDVSPKSSGIAKKMFDIKVERGFIDDCLNDHFNFQDYGLVCLAAVLEHLKEPAQTLKRIGNQMYKGGLLYIEVPAGDQFFKQKGEPFGEFSLEHINYFGVISLKNILRPAGFNCIAQSYQKYSNKTVGLHMLFAKIGKKNSQIQPDAPLLISIKRYIDYSKKRMKAVNKRLKNIQKKKIIIYGAGSHTARLLRQTSLKKRNVLFIADKNNNLHGRKMDGILIDKPQRIRSYPDAPILISSYLYESSILKDIKAKFKNPAIALYPRA